MCQLKSCHVRNINPIIVGGGAGLVVALAGVDWILRSAPVTTVIRPVAVAIACATGGLLVAAFLEAYAIQKAWG